MKLRLDSGCILFQEICAGMTAGVTVAQLAGKVECSLLKGKSTMFFSSSIAVKEATNPPKSSLHPALLDF